MKIHHFGYLVKNGKKSEQIFSELGYEKRDEWVKDEKREVNILFMEKDGCLIELIEPEDHHSAYYPLLSRYKNTVYHICYETDNYKETDKQLRDMGVVCFQKTEEAIALQRNLVAFYMHPHMGMIEILVRSGHTGLQDGEQTEGIFSYEILKKKYGDKILGEHLFSVAQRRKKQIAAVYGNCHFHVITKYLSKAPDFLKNYILVFIPPVFDMEKLGICHISEFLLEHLDLLIYQNINHDNLYGAQWSTEEILKRVPEECVRICVPNTVFFGYFPQEGRRRNTILKNRINQVPMFCGDKYIDKVFAEKMSISKTIECLSDKEAIPENDILSNLKKSFRMLEIQDMGCHIPMKDYVEGNYQKKYLFTEPKHPANCFFREMTERILRYLKLDDEIQNADELDQENTLSTINRLLYPSVKKVLKLDFTVTEYYCDRRLTEQKLNFAEFIEVYIRNTFPFDEFEFKKE